MTDALTNTLDNLETEVMEALDNPYRTYSVKFSYQVSFSFPDDDHHTQITIQSTSEILRYGRDQQDVEHQMELDQAHGRPTYAKHLINWISKVGFFKNPGEASSSKRSLGHGLLHAWNQP